MMRKNFSKIAKSLVVFAFVLLTVVWTETGNVTADAFTYVGSADNFAQTGAQKHDITMTWGAAENATAYNVYYKETYGEGDYQLVGTTSITTITLSNLKAATKYSIKLEPTNGVQTGSYSVCYDAVTLPDQMEGLRQERWYYYIKILDVAWDDQSAADGYEVILLDDKGKKVQSETVTGHRASFSKMKDKVYSVKARSFMTFNNQKYYSSWSQIYCLNQARLTKVKVNGGKLNLSWGKISGATGYQVYVSTNASKGYKKVASINKNKTSYTVKKFKGKKFSPKKTYYVYVKTVCNKKGSKNTSGALYFWNNKNKDGYVS